MTLKTEWVNDPQLRNKLGYFDIGVIGIQLTYNLVLVLYALYLDASLICRYFWHRIKKTFCFRYYRSFVKMIDSLGIILNLNNKQPD